MRGDEKKLYIILHDSFREMMLEGRGDARTDFERNSLKWYARVCLNLKAKFTSIRRRSDEKFYVQDPVNDMCLGTMMGKPRVYIEMDVDVAMKILVLGYLP